MKAFLRNSSSVVNSCKRKHCHYRSSFAALNVLNILEANRWGVPSAPVDLLPEFGNGTSQEKENKGRIE